MLAAETRESHVRRRRKERLDAEVCAVTVARAYRLLKASCILWPTTAWSRNPCRIKGASLEDSPEHPVLTAHEVLYPAAAIDPRYQALVLLAVFAPLRPGNWQRFGAKTSTSVRAPSRCPHTDGAIWRWPGFRAANV